MLQQIHQHFLLFSVIFFVMGYLIGFIVHSNKHIDHQQIVNESFFDQQNKRKKDIKKKNIDIDNSTHVVSIKTDGLEKKYEEIGTSHTKQENISSSINKLKNLKKE